MRKILIAISLLCGLNNVSTISARKLSRKQALASQKYDGCYSYCQSKGKSKGKVWFESCLNSCFLTSMNTSCVSGKCTKKDIFLFFEWLNYPYRNWLSSFVTE